MLKKEFHHVIDNIPTVCVFRVKALPHWAKRDGLSIGELVRFSTNDGYSTDIRGKRHVLRPDHLTFVGYRNKNNWATDNDVVESIDENKDFMRKFIDAAGNDPYALEKAANVVVAKWEEFMDDFGGREETMPWELDPDSGDFDDSVPEYDQLVYDTAKEHGVGYDALRVYMHERYKAERYG